MAYLGAAALGAGLGLAARRAYSYGRALPQRIANAYQRAGANRAQRRAAERVRLASMNRTFSPRFAKNQALKLGRLTYPCVLKMPIVSAGRYIKDGQQSAQYTMTVRACPFGKKTAYYGLGMPVNTLFEQDVRFRTLCSLYSEFHISSVTYTIQIISPAGDIFSSGAEAASNINDITIFANVIRNAPSSMDYTALQSDDFLSVPGLIWARPKTSVSYPSLKVTIREKTLEEKMQWLPTSNNGESQLNWVADDSAIKWFPAVDFAFSTPRGWGSAQRIYFSVVCRAIVKFRSGKLPTAPASGTSKEIISRATSRATVEKAIPPGSDVTEASRAVLGYEPSAPVVNDE